MITVPVELSYSNNLAYYTMTPGPRHFDHTNGNAIGSDRIRVQRFVYQVQNHLRANNQTGHMENVLKIRNYQIITSSFG
jgi:hypothetical protein